MSLDINNILDENAKLIDDLKIQLDDTRDVIEAIKKGNIDALLLVHNKSAKVLVSKTADQSYRKFIQHMTEGVITIHSEGMILYSNNSFALMVQLPLEKVTGCNFKDFISADHLKKFETLTGDINQEKSKVELGLIDHEGKKIFVIASLHKVVNKELVTINLVLTDISELKKVEESLLNVIERLKLIIDKHRLAEKELVTLNDGLKDHIRKLEEANIKKTKIS